VPAAMFGLASGTTKPIGMSQAMTFQATREAKQGTLHCNHSSCMTRGKAEDASRPADSWANWDRHGRTGSGGLPKKQAAFDNARDLPAPHWSRSRCRPEGEERRVQWSRRRVGQYKLRHPYSPL